MSKERFRCPQCGSTSVWVRVSILAKRKYNGTRIYDIDTHDYDDYFSGDCGCDKCGWCGSEDKLNSHVSVPEGWSWSRNGK